MTENERYLLRRIGEITIEAEAQKLLNQSEVEELKKNINSLLKQVSDLETENEQLKNTTRDLALSAMATSNTDNTEE